MPRPLCAAIPDFALTSSNVPSPRLRWSESGIAGNHLGWQ